MVRQIRATPTIHAIDSRYPNIKGTQGTIHTKVNPMRPQTLKPPLLLAICALSWLPTQSGAESYLDQFSGTYKLSFSENTGRWREHRLEITSISSEKVSGNVVIDWNVGRESRMPEPHEKEYVCMFEAERKNSSEAITFSVAVGDFEQVVYSFQIYLMLEDDVPIAVGIVTVKRDDQKLGPISHYVHFGTQGIFARIIRED